MMEYKGWGSFDPEGDERESFYRWHVRGAWVRASASLIMWMVCLGAYVLGLVHRQNLVADTVAVSFLILMNPPLLWTLKRIPKKRPAERFGFLINTLETFGYTAVIYALGGIEATYLLPIYAALVTYVGIRGPGIRPFLVAGLCSLAFGAMLTLEHLGYLPSLRINPAYQVSWIHQMAILCVTASLLMIVAFIAAYTSGLLKLSRERLARRNEELQWALAKARESDRLKSEFLANISHELRTPLNAILGFSELFQEQASGPLNEKQQEWMRDIHDSGAHLLSLISELLDLSRLEVGRMELDLSDTNLPRLLEEGTHIFQEKVRERKLTLVSELAECPAVLRGDERRLRQILYNLLSNALKFTPPGGEIRLTVRALAWVSGCWRDAAGEAVELPFGPDEMRATSRGIVEIRVADTGIGIRAGDLERIFNPFEQADGSLSRRYEGTGLGLTLIRRFVELHGGRIWAESQGEGRGSVFRVVLPQ